jgi:TonB-dependent starch-binding outer membrane protein SusC
MKKTEKKKQVESKKTLKIGRILLSLLFSVFVMQVSAQGTKIQGKVVDATGEPIPGVTVVLKGTTIGAVTDISGLYSFEVNVSDNSILVFSYVGMKPKEVAINGQNQIDVTLEDDVLGLDEVIVVGYGSQQKKDVTGSVEVINSKKMEGRPNTQFGDLIQGKAAGVELVSNSGKPSQGFNLRIRGTNSINASSEPLYVVDGVPTSDTRALNPSDIESISILKDASSAAIYGAQGANGVVLITTKKGKTERPVVSLDAYYGFSQVWNTLPVLNGEQYRDLMTEMGLTTDWTKYNKNTDWQNEVFQNGASQNYQISFSGAKENTSYYVSAGWVQQKGAVRSSEMDRMNFKVNLDQKITNWFSVGTRVAYTDYNDVDITDNTNVNKGGVLLGTLTTPSVIGIYNEDGTFTSNPFQDWENPIASTDGSDRGYNSKRLLANVFAKIDFTKDLSFKSNYGIDHSNGIYDYFLDPYRTSYGRALQGTATSTTDRTSFFIFDNTVNFNKKIAEHSIEILAGSVIQKYLWENTSITTQNFSGDGVKTVNGGSTITSATATKSEKANSSFIGRLNYGYADKYLLTANFRIDGSSVFGPDKRWGFFPSFSLGWRISKESFMENLTFISDLKLRAGWGVVGNDNIDAYAYLGTVGTGANYPIGGETQPGTYPASIQNNSLKWEESKQTNVGIDAAFLNGRLKFTADAYYKKTSDLLLNAPLPKSTGFDSGIQNIGELENKGLEFSVGSVNVDGEIKWTTDFNISFNRNKVTNLIDQEIYAGDVASRGSSVKVIEGKPLGSLFGYVWGGVDPETGNAYYIGADGASTFSPTADDRTFIGDANPDFLYGMTNTVSYKGIGLSVFLQGSQGNDLLNATRIETEGMTDAKNQSTAVLNRWRNAGDQTNIPKISYGNTDNSRISTRFVEDGSYLRIKTVSLSYSLPEKIISRVKLQGVTVYATGENLFTFTDYSGFDPEVNAFGSSNTARGVDFGTYPQTRNLIFGLNVKF